MRAATLLAMACERSGLVTRFRSACEIGLIADGEHLNANPVSIKPEVLSHDLEKVDLVVVPGYVAENAAGEPVLLGRGGSDLTAVYVARALGVSVRLIKDVDAIYDADPATVGDQARPYEALDWSKALKIAFPVVQNKAMRYAADQGMQVEVAGLAKGYQTVMGGETAERRQPVLKRKIRIAVMGAGGVGSKFLERCLEWSDAVEVDRVLVRDASKRRDHPLAAAFTSDVRNFVRPDVDVFVDIGTGVSPFGRTAGRLSQGRRFGDQRQQAGGGGGGRQIARGGQGERRDADLFGVGRRRRAGHRGAETRR
ncbi:MAG: hypothetical protein WDN06_00870 [Asticcacaulis sp.]